MRLGPACSRDPPVRTRTGRGRGAGREGPGQGTPEKGDVDGAGQAWFMMRGYDRVHGVMAGHVRARGATSPTGLL